MQPPVTLLDHTQILRELLNVYKSSFVGDESAEKLQKGFQQVLDLMVDAAVNMCLTVADARQSQKVGWDGDIFVLNCLSHLLVSSFVDVELLRCFENMEERHQPLLFCTI